MTHIWAKNISLREKKTFHREDQRFCVKLIPTFVMGKFNIDNCKAIEKRWYGSGS